MGPLSKVVDKAVFLWVVVDVCDQPAQLRVRGDANAAKRPLEERSSPTVRLVERLGVRVKEVGKGLAGGPGRFAI
jgi:hypothetical protein